MLMKMMRHTLALVLTMGVVAGYAQESDAIEATEGVATEANETVEAAEATEVAKPAVPSRKVLLDRIVAIVGNTSILLSEVNSLAVLIEEDYRAQNYTSDRDIISESLEELMVQRLLSTRARIDSVEVNLSHINYQIEMQVDQMSEAAGGIKELERIHNMEIYNIRDVLRRSMEDEAYAQAMQREVTSTVTVVPGEVDQYYRKQDRDSLPIIGEQYRYAQITRFPKSMEEAKRRTVERLLDMRSKVIDGSARFSSLARMYSVDTSTASRGGELEPLPSSALEKSFGDALELMKPGQISEVVETSFGYHIIELIEKRGSLFHFRHILLRPTYSAEELMEPSYFLDSLATEIRRDSISFESAAMLYSDDSSTKMNGGIVTNHDALERYNAYDAKLTMTKFLKEDFGARGYKSLDDFTALSKLKVGEVSNSFTTEDLMGNHMSKIVKLVQIYPAHIASIEEDYIQLEGLALVEKQEKMLREWLKENIYTTYIYIDPEFRNLEFKYNGWVR